MPLTTAISCSLVILRLGSSADKSLLRTTPAAQKAAVNQNVNLLISGILSRVQYAPRANLMISAFYNSPWPPALWLSPGLFLASLIRRIAEADYLKSIARQKQRLATPPPLTPP